MGGGGEKRARKKGRKRERGGGGGERDFHAFFGGWRKLMKQQFHAGPFASF